MNNAQRRESQTPASTAAAILAGGKAKRYGGRAKGALRLPAGNRMIDRLLDELTSSGIEGAAIFTSFPDAYVDCGRPIVPDHQPGLGPLGGIETALTYYEDDFEAVLFLPCDLPAITAAEIRILQSAFEEGLGRVVVAQTEGFFWQPLCAVVHTALAPGVRQAIGEGERSVYRLWRALGATPVAFKDARPFFNVNTPKDLDLWSMQGETS